MTDLRIESLEDNIKDLTRTIKDLERKHNGLDARHGWLDEYVGRIRWHIQDFCLYVYITALINIILISVIACVMSFSSTIVILSAISMIIIGVISIWFVLSINDGCIN